MRFEDFQNGHCGCHLGYWNRAILAILNLYVALISPIGLIQFTVWEEMSYEEFKAAVAAILDIGMEQF